MEFERSDIVQLTSSIWESVLAMDLVEAPPPASPGAADEELLTGCIQISGAWNGVVTLRCPRPLAVRMAAVMFDLDPAELGDAEVDDALGELTNMTGGNIKGLVGGSAQLSLPAVAQGRDYRLRVPGSHTVLALAFTCEGHAIEVTILEQDEPHAGSVAPAAAGAASA